MFSSPFGPLTDTLAPLISRETPEGRATGLLPIRDMLGNYAENFATDVLRAGFFARHKTVAGGEDRYTKSMEDGLEFLRSAVTARSRLADTLYCERWAIGIESDFELLFGCFTDHFDIRDPTLALKQFAE